MKKINLHLKRPFGRRDGAEASLMAQGIGRELTQASAGKVLVWSIGTAGEKFISAANGLNEAEIIKSEDGEAGTAIAAAAGAALQGYKCIVAGDREVFLGRGRRGIVVALENQADVVLVGLDQGKTGNGSKLDLDLTVIVPADGWEVSKALRAAMEKKGARWISVALWPVAEATTDSTPYQEGRASLWKQGRDLAIIATGPASAIGLLAADEMVEKDLSCSLLHVPGLWPIDEPAVLAAIEEGSGRAVTIGYEEEGIILGQRIALITGRKRVAPPDHVILEKPSKQTRSGFDVALKADIDTVKKALVKAAKKKRP